MEDMSSRDHEPSTCAATPKSAAPDPAWVGRPQLLQDGEIHYRQERSKLNHKIAWCMTLPLLGWFGRLSRLEAEHGRASARVRIMQTAIRLHTKERA